LAAIIASKKLVGAFSSTGFFAMRAARRDNLPDLGPDGGDRGAQFPILHQPEHAPVGERRAEAAGQHRGHLLEMLLDDGTVRLHRVEIDPDGKLWRDVDGVAHRLGAQVHRLPTGREALPAPAQTLRRSVHGCIARIEVR
jgi:hypothetical protein